MDKFFSTPAEINSLTLGKKFAARRKSLMDHIQLLKRRRSEPKKKALD